MARFEFSLAFALLALAAAHAKAKRLAVDQIVGGDEATPGEFPFLVLLKMVDKSTSKPVSCGGSIIHERFILTAAHCVDTIDPDRSSVGIGCHYRSDCKASIGFERVMMHPKYGNKHNDIAMIKLKHKVPFHKLSGKKGANKIVPLAIYDVYKSPKSLKLMTLAGWGRINHDTSLNNSDNQKRFRSEVLKKVRIPLIPLSRCQRNYENITNANICAGNEGHGQCRGDSGGPLLQSSPTEGLVQVGLVSRSVSCATASGGVFARVASHYSWIKSCLKERPECEKL